MPKKYGASLGLTNEEETPSASQTKGKRKASIQPKSTITKRPKSIIQAKIITPPAATSSSNSSTRRLPNDNNDPSAGENAAIIKELRKHIEVLEKKNVKLRKWKRSWKLKIRNMSEEMTRMAEEDSDSEDEVIEENDDGLHGHTQSESDRQSELSDMPSSIGFAASTPTGEEIREINISTTSVRQPQCEEDEGDDISDSGTERAINEPAGSEHWNGDSSSARSTTPAAYHLARPSCLPCSLLQSEKEAIEVDRKSETEELISVTRKVARIELEIRRYYLLLSRL